MAKMKRKPVLICCGVLLALIVALVVVFLALYFTVFRPRAPRVMATVVGTEISGFNPVHIPPLINLTMHVEVTVSNPNYASFRYGEVDTTVRYHGDAVGQSVMPAGEIGARATTTVAVTVEVETDKVVFTPYFLGEALGGDLPFETSTAVAGKAMVLGTIKVRASSDVVCHVSVDVLKNNSTTKCSSTVRMGQ